MRCVCGRDTLTDVPTRATVNLHFPALFTVRDNFTTRTTTQLASVVYYAYIYKFKTEIRNAVYHRRVTLTARMRSYYGINVPSAFNSHAGGYSNMLLSPPSWEICAVSCLSVLFESIVLPPGPES